LTYLVWPNPQKNRLFKTDRESKTLRYYLITDKVPSKHIPCVYASSAVKPKD